MTMTKNCHFRQIFILHFIGITSKWFCLYAHKLLDSLLHGRLKRQDYKTHISERVTREHIHHKSSLFENPQCHLCKFWPSLLPTNDLLLPHIQDRRNLFDRPLPICLAFEKIHSFFESEVESIGFLWGSGRGAMYINLISTKKLLLNWRFFPTLYKRLKHKHRKNCECCPGHYLSTSVY